jgi:hypothetical protein
VEAKGQKAVLLRERNFLVDSVEVSHEAIGLRRPDFLFLQQNRLFDRVVVFTAY